MARVVEDGKERAVARLSKTTVEDIPLPPAGRRSALWDTEVKGFGVRVSPGGARTYVLVYRMGGRDASKRTATIGRHGSPWTADQARRRAFELLSQVRSGVDPLAERARERDAAAAEAGRREARMFEAQVDRWYERRVVRRNLRSASDIKGVVERDLKSAFKGVTIDEITREKVAAALDVIGRRSEPAANKAHKWLRAIFNWFIDRGLLTTSPLDRMKRPFSEESRTRTLSLLELVVVWVATGAQPAPFRDFYRAAVLLGQRLREVARALRSEFDLKAAEWLIPAARTKNKRDHLVPLPPQAVSLLEPLVAGRNDPTGPVFTSDGAVPIAGFSKSKAALDEAVEALLDAHPAARAALGGGVAPWVVHDLRRTLATGCQGMDVRMEVTEAVLNHVSGRRGGIASVYQLYDYFDEKADALTGWAALVEAGVKLWTAGDVAGIIELDPARSARRRRRKAVGPAAMGFEHS